MTKTIAVFGAGPGLGRSVAHRFGREEFRVALVARSRERLDVFVQELAAAGIEAAGFTADLTDRDKLPDLIAAITTRFGHIDVLEYAPSGLDWLNHKIDVRDTDAEAFEFPLDLLLRTPATLVRQVLSGMIERGDGAVLFGLAVSASAPFPPLSNIGAVGAAARSYLHDLNVSLADTGVYAGLLQVAGMVADSDAARFAAENWEAASLPEPLNPDELADALWNLYDNRDRFEKIVGDAAA